ncbi:MAG: HNH endonuclease [Clostridiales Family XIII bacterium]|nr:HNH endonuclease [Clostridiales Family XIII bacterium]
MAAHQHDTNCNEIWLYFQAVINWVKATFPEYRKEMKKGLEWGVLYNKYGAGKYDPKALEARVADLMQDEDISRYPGVYEYLLSGEDKATERVLSIRAFTPQAKRAAYERQKGVCPKCKEHFGISGMQADHITPWSRGGRTITENCQMLCDDCNRRKSNV